MWPINIASVQPSLPLPYPANRVLSSMRFTGVIDVLPKYLQSGRIGFYLTVLESGEVGAGNPIDLVERHPLGVTPGDIARLYLGQSLDRELLDRTLRIEIFK